MSKPDTSFPLVIPHPNANNVVFSCGDNKEVLKLTPEGMFYKGRFIEDAGEARKAFLEAMRALKDQGSSAIDDETREALKEAVANFREDVLDLPPQSRLLPIYLKHIAALERLRGTSG